MFCSPRSKSRAALGLALFAGMTSGLAAPAARAGVTSEDVEQAIRGGVKFLKAIQRPDGSWPEVAPVAPTGPTSLATLALLTAGEKVDSAVIQRALAYLRDSGPQRLNSAYAIGLQTMVYAAAEPEKDRLRMTANVEWLERAQHKDARREFWPGNWPYGEVHLQPGDNSNTQYALLGLNAASEVGIAVQPAIWELSRAYFEHTQNRDGGWGYTPRHKQSTASMTCAGISSLIICGSRRYESLESLEGEKIQRCGEGGFDPHLRKAIDWLATRFDVRQNVGHGQQYKYYYLYGLERAGRLSGVRFFGQNDWYRLGAEEIVAQQNKLSGFWRGAGENELVATSLALLFLAKGRAGADQQAAPFGQQRLEPRCRRRAEPRERRLPQLEASAGVASRRSEYRHASRHAFGPDRIFQWSRCPRIRRPGRKNLQEFVEQGGFIFAEACCGYSDFDRGFRKLMKQVFPEPEYQLRRLPPDHPVWRARHLLSPEIHPLWGIEHGCRTIAIYSPKDLSCYWNQADRHPTNPAVIKALRIAENIVDYATGREMPADKLAVHEIHNAVAQAPRRGALRIAKLKHGGEWNIAPQAIPNLMKTLRQPPLSFNAEIAQKDLFAHDPLLIYYPLVYVHGRAGVRFDKADIDALRQHLEPGGGTLFGDAACGSPAFDLSFRRLVAELLPAHPLEPIPPNDPLLSSAVGFDLKDVQYTSAAGGQRGYPQLEGIKIDDHWAVIYSKYDIGCALERPNDLDCKGYTHASAARIAANIVLYSTLP